MQMEDGGLCDKEPVLGRLGNLSVESLIGLIEEITNNSVSTLQV